MEERLNEQLDGLVEKYTELLIGDTSVEMQNKVRAWIVYSFIAKSMPPLVKHWNATYPDGKEEIKKVIEEIKHLNEEKKANKE